MKRALEFRGGNLFFLPAVFLAVLGLRVLGIAADRMDDSGWAVVGYLALSGAFFLAAAIAGGWVQRMNDTIRIHQALQRQHPEQPWCWHPEWHSRRIPVRRPGAVRLFVAFSLVWTVMSVAGLGSVLSEGLSGEGSFPRKHSDAIVLILGAMVLVVGGVMSVVSVRRALRARRLERCFLELESLPATLGRTLAGAFWMEPAKWVRDDVRVTIRNVQPGAYEPDVPTETLWEATVSATVRPEQSGAWITFTVPIPSGVRPTTFGGSAWEAGRWEVQCGEACIEVPVIQAAEGNGC
jgi:hypothetical protein